MSIKKIFPSNGNSKGAESSVVTYNDVTGQVSGSKASAVSMTVGSLNGLLQEVGGVVTAIDTTTAVSGNILQANGGQFAPAAATLETLGGDLSGILSNPTVRSISNVVSGTLKISVGGTNKNALSASAPLVLGSNRTSPTSNSVITMNSAGGDFAYADKSVVDIVPLTSTIVYLYTGSIGVSNTFTWTKPTGARFVRVICQGGGGGGGGGSSYGSYTGWMTGGCGGGGGGYSETIFNASFIQSGSINITIGLGGIGGIGSAGGWVNGTAGSSGTSSSFGNYVSGLGGSGGSSNSGGGSSVGGVGFRSNGGAGGALAANSTAVSAGADSYRSPGGGQGATTKSKSIGVGAAGGSTNGNIIVSGGSISTDSIYNFKNYYLNNVLTQQQFPIKACGGGNGGNTGITGGSVIWGSGGGGGGNLNGQCGNGGKGGDGYVIIICY